MSEKNELLEILLEEEKILDLVLEGQQKMHIAVKEKNWIGLEDTISYIQKMSDAFIVIDTRRQELTASDAKLITPECSKIMSSIHAKLLKSKIENKAMTDFISITQTFVQGVLDKAVPQRRNVLYSRKGKIVRAQPESVVLNRVF